MRSDSNALNWFWFSCNLLDQHQEISKIRSTFIDHQLDGNHHCFTSKPILPIFTDRKEINGQTWSKNRSTSNLSQREYEAAFCWSQKKTRAINRTKWVNKLVKYYEFEPNKNNSIAKIECRYRMKWLLNCKTFFLSGSKKIGACIRPF